MWQSAITTFHHSSNFRGFYKCQFPRQSVLIYWQLPKPAAQNILFHWFDFPPLLSHSSLLLHSLANLCFGFFFSKRRGREWCASLGRKKGRKWQAGRVRNSLNELGEFQWIYKSDSATCTWTIPYIQDPFEIFWNWGNVTIRHSAHRMKQ